MLLTAFILSLLALGYCQDDNAVLRLEKEGCISASMEIRINAAYKDTQGSRREAHYKVPSNAFTEVSCDDRALHTKKAHISIIFSRDTLILDFSAPAVSGKTISLVSVNYTYLTDPERFYMAAAQHRNSLVKPYPVGDMKFGEWKKTYSCSGRLLDLGGGVNIELINMRLALFRADARSADVVCPTPYIATTPVPAVSHTTRDFSQIGRTTRWPSLRTTASPFGSRGTTGLYPRLTTRDWRQQRTTEPYDDIDMEETTRHPRFTTRDWRRTTANEWESAEDTTRPSRFTTTRDWRQQRTTDPWDTDYTTRYPRYTTRDWHIRPFSTSRPWMHATTEDSDPITVGDYDTWNRRTTRDYPVDRWTTRDWRRRTTPEDDNNDDEAVTSPPNENGGWGRTTPSWQQRLTTENRRQQRLTTWEPLKK